MTIYSLDVLLFLFGTSLFFHVQFQLLLPDLHTGFSGSRSGGLVFPSLSEFSAVYCDQFLEISAPNLLAFSVAKSYPTLRPHGQQHTRLPCPSPTPRACSNSWPLSRWYHPTISSSVLPFSCLQTFPASGSFPNSQFSSGGQTIEVSASASVLPMNIQDWFLLGWTGWIFLLSKGLPRVFSNTTVQKHQFFGSQLYLCSNSHIYTWLLEKS